MAFPEQFEHFVRADESLAPHLWLGIGGPAQYFAEPIDKQQLTEVYTEAVKSDLPVRILGGGSNVLVREAGFPGLVISLASAATSELSIDNTRLVAGAGAKLSHAVIKSVGEGLGGLEHLVGIPGTVGGAVVGNASNGGRDIGSVVESITVIESDGSLRIVPGQDAGFSHRKTALGGLGVIEVTFLLESRDPLALTKRMQKLWISRNATLPSEHGRIAMPFVDPDGMPAKDLIQNCGLAGIREGDVSLDSEQPHFLIAHGAATSEQCLRLIDRVREQVLLQTGIDLQLNLQIW